MIDCLSSLSTPTTSDELLARTAKLSGMTLAELAIMHHQKLPDSLKQAKGFIGQLIELSLGATAGSQPEPDFPHLGIELKTIPINSKGEPCETTYVCTAPHTLPAQIEYWENSRVKQKLSQVLWVPIEADPSIPLPKRHIGTAILWHLDSTTEKILRQDWEELTYMLHLGKTTRLSAKIGTYLHLRPKAAHSRVLTQGIGEEGEPLLINPRGFYLRTAFTQKILKKYYF